MTDSPPPEPWTLDRTLRVLLTWTAFTTVVFWLPTIRGAFDGPSYEWALMCFSGRGLRGDYWFPLLGVAFALGVQVLGWRGALTPFHFLLAGWHLLLAFGSAYVGLTDPEGFRLQGDTLGIDVSLAWVGLVIFGLPAALACRWAWRDLHRQPRPPAAPWQGRNTRWLAGLLALLPIQLALLRFGAPGSLADQIGVVLTVIQWLLVGRALRPYPPARAA